MLELVERLEYENKTYLRVLKSGVFWEHLARTSPTFRMNIIEMERETLPAEITTSFRTATVYCSPFKVN